MDLLSNLNESQIEAVTATEGYVRVIAGAGSGKTKLLVSRYAYLVRDYGIDTASILCVTFTNKAAGEMKKRIRALIGDENDTALICTYHGFCARVIREDANKLFLTKGFQIIDTSQQKSILEEIYQKHELKLDHASFESILKKVGIAKSKMNYVPRMCSPSPCQILDSVLTTDDTIVEEFIQRQKATYSLDFHDLINFAIYLLRTDSEVREKWQERLNYIQVDEFQDSSKREMELVDILSEKFGNLMIVGDPDQNIYEWRGSDVKLLVDFDTSHEGTQTVLLKRNYRSTPQILKCANTLIDKNVMRIKKDLYTESPDGAPVYHYHSKTEDDENAAIVANIKLLKKEHGYSYSDFAVLYRSGFLSRVVEKKLVESGIPYEIYGGVKFYQRMEVLDVIAYLRLIAFDDDLSFKRIVNTPRRRFGRSKMAALETLRDEDISMFDGEMGTLFSTLKNHLSESPFKSSDAAAFVSFIEEMRNSCAAMRISEIVRRVTEGLGYEQYIRELGDEERLENLAEFKRIADEFERSFGESLTLADFLQQVALQSAEDGDKAREAVKLMTIHAAKGLEFPVVFTIGFTEGVFPSSKTIEERKAAGLEEERRLCYVALTRAREHLFLMDSEGVSQNGIKKLPSRFLSEIGENNYIRIGEITDDLAAESRKYSRKLDSATVSFARNVGDKVEHHAFGKGTIISRDEKRGSYTVKFDKLKMPRTLYGEFVKPNSYTPPEYAPRFTDDNSADEDVGTQSINPTTYDVITDEISVDDSVLTDAAFEEFPDDDSPFAETQENALGIPEISAECSNAEESEVFEEQERLHAFERVAKPDNLKVTELESAEAEPVENALTEEEQAALQKHLEECDNLWKRPDVPHSGWRCTGVADLGKPIGVCEMCGYQIIRYVHHMVHDSYPPVDAGCVCAGRMEGNVAAAKKREQECKNRLARHNNFISRKWKKSRSGNDYAKIKEHVVVLYKIKQTGVWKYSIDNKFSVDVFETREEAVEAAFIGMEAVMGYEKPLGVE